MDNRPAREEIDPRYTWDLTRIYESDEAWERAFAEVKAMAEAFSARQGAITQSRERVRAALDDYMAMSEKLGGVYLYALLKRSTDSVGASAQAMADRASALYSEAMARSAFLVPELLTLPQEELDALIADPAFGDYDAFLRDAARMKPHTLGAAEERLLALSQEMQGTPDAVFGMLADADLDLGRTRGEDGRWVKLTDARFRGLLGSENRAVRRGAFQRMMAGYGRMGNTIAALYAGQVKADLFVSRARGYESPRQAALNQNDVDERVYDSLIEAVHGGIGTLNAYLDAKREAMGLSRIHLYDLYVDAKKAFDVRMNLEEAFAAFLEAVAPLGEDYVRDASRALPERWIDAYETKGKSAGAFCASSAYWTTPYVMLNHKDDYDSLSALCHEMGHAMHSFYSMKAQPYAKSDYAIFVAEVASTVNEVLLFESMRKRYADDRAAQRSLLGEMLEHFRTTVFRQTMFAEFEHEAHELARAGESLTQERLSALYLALNKTYYGGACVVDACVQNEWMRIPHFYSPYYVYQYATGFCAAVALARGILSGDPDKAAAYRRFLSLGGSMPPLCELRVAGVDMSTPKPVCEALDYFAELLLEYRELMREE